MNLAYVLLIAGVLISAYILVGYPLLLAMASWKYSRPVAKQLNYQSAVTVIVAVYNGAQFIRGKLDSILSLDYPSDLMQVIIVSDGSTDSTNEIVKEYEARGVILYVVPHAGKASALNRALEGATGDILFFTDVRQPIEKSALRHLVANFADPTVGAVTGELRLMRGSQGEQADMDLYWRYEVWARKIHSRIDSIFASTGCILAIRRSLAGPIPADTLSDDAVLPLRAFLQGYRVVFDPEAIATDYPAAASTEFRRRCRNLAGLWQVFVRLPHLFTSKNRMWLHFLSHKFGRLILPWSLLLVAGSTLALPSSLFRTELLSSDIALLALAVADRWIPKGFPLKRISSPARTFLTMNAASIAALRVFLVSPNSLWIPTRVDPPRGNASS